MDGENNKSFEDTGFYTFAKSTEENQPSFHTVKTSTETWNILMPEVC